MKVIENLTLDISMTGAWSGDNIKVTAKVWNGKITKTGTLSGSYTLDSIGLDESMQNDEYAVVNIVTSQYIGSSRNQHSSTYRQLYVRPIAKKGWDLAYSKRSNWANKYLKYGENVVIQVPSSTYGDYSTFTVQAQLLDIYDIGSSQNNSSYPNFKTVYVYDSSETAIAGPFDCYTEDVYNKGKTDGWIAAANSEIGCNNKSISPGYSTTITVPSSSGYGNTKQFTITGVSSGGGGGDCCFPAGTPVLLADGTTMPIEKLTVGTIVVGYDPDTQQFCETEIMRTIQKKHRNDIYELERADGVTFLMTANHVVLTKNGWKAIDPERGKYGVPDEDITELIIGDELLGVNGNYIKIENIKYRDDLQDQNVYNIDVEEVDTFIAYGIVAHNDVDCGNQ